MTPRERRTNMSNMPSLGYINDTQIATFVGYIVNIEKMFGWYHHVWSKQNFLFYWVLL